MEQSTGAVAGGMSSGRGFTATHATSGGGSSSASWVQPTTRGIDQGGWSIRVTSGPIGSSAEMDALSDVLGIPPPEMAFPHNCLVLQHHQSGFSLCFDAVRTLRSVDGVRAHNFLRGIDCASVDGKAGRKQSSAPGEKPKPGSSSKSSIKVAYAKEWGKSRNDYTQTLPGEGSGGHHSTATPSFFGADVAKKAVAAQTAEISTAKDYDWTYSTTWAGSIGDTLPQPLLPSSPYSAAAPSASKEWFVPGTDPTRDRIPVERLGPSSGEPILFYDDIVLFEDELADNGSSMVNIKVRVMPSGFLVLQRFFLRVDDVVFRVFDTRLYCQFDTSESKSDSSHQDNAVSAGLSNMSLGSTSSQAEHSSTRSTAAQQERGSPQRLIRECSGSEATYAEVRAHLPPYKSNDLSPLTDVQWVSNVLSKISINRSAKYHAGVASGHQLPTMHSADASVGNKFLSASASATGFPGSRPGEKVDLSPARAPAFSSGTGAPWARNGGSSAPTLLPDAQIVGQLVAEDTEASMWAGNGARVDVATLR